MRRALFAALLITATPAALMPAQAAGKVAANKADAVKKPAKAVTPKNDRNDFVALALDEVHTLAFNAPVSTVYVGNPAIADVTMIDARHAFVQGKGYGRTNVLALNRDNVVVFNTHITVTGNNGGGTVTLNRGAQRVTLNCAGGRCEPTPMPGDGKESYDVVNTQSSSHQQVARGAATAAEAKN
jgi:Flp pilus assembly secretin CpaC